jgi:NADPH:quinone reductase-like Zn-dependent oxidoreductase
MPRAVRFHRIGGPENLVLETVPLRRPTEREARLRVAAVGLNRAEALFMRGQYFEQPVLRSMSVRGYSLMEIKKDPAVLKASTKHVYDRLEDGRFRPTIAKTFPLDQAADAYRYLESNAQVGKVVITI